MSDTVLTPDEILDPPAKGEGDNQNVTVYTVVSYRTSDGGEIPAVMALTENKATLLRALLESIEAVKSGNQSNKSKLAGLKTILTRFDQMLAEKPGDELPDDLKNFSG